MHKGIYGSTTNAIIYITCYIIMIHVMHMHSIQYYIKKKDQL